MRAQHLSSPVEYRRGVDTYTVNATFGKTDYEVEDEYGMRVGAAVVDFLILTENLPFEPKAGDRIIADGRTYEVMPLAGQGPWRWSDPYRQTYRIHTKDIGPA